MKKTDQYTGVNNPESYDCSACGMLTILANNHGSMSEQSEPGSWNHGPVWCHEPRLGDPLGHVLPSPEIF